MQGRSLAAKLDRHHSLWDVAVLLLNYWRARPPSHIPPPQHFDERVRDRWADLKRDVEDVFRGRVHGKLTDEDRRMIATWVKGEDLDAIHAVASGIDEEAWVTFFSSWRDNLPLLDDQRYAMRPSDLYPVSGRVWGSGTPLAVSSPPSDDELAHIRIHHPHAAQTRKLVFDFSFEEQLEPIFDSLATLATVHPNVDVRDFRRNTRQSPFPIRVADEKRQLECFRRLLSVVERTAAQVVVSPEHAATDGVLEAAQAWLDASDAPRLLVPGTIHEGDRSTASNVAYGLVPGRSERLTHRKLIPLAHERRSRPLRETLAPVVEIVVYAANRFRIALLVCKDLLPRGGSSIRTALVDAGVNVVLIPSMSEQTEPFTLAIPSLVEAGAVVVFANGPLRWTPPASAIAVYGQPYAAHPMVVVKPTASRTARPGVSLLRIGQSSAKWRSLRRRA